MFDVSWTDPERETVGQRKNRKEQRANGLSRTPSLRSAKSSDTSQSQFKPSIFSLFGNSKRSGLSRTGSQSKGSVLRNEQSSKASRRASSYTVSSEPRIDEVPDCSTRIPINPFSGPTHNTDGQSSSSYASESVFSGWTDRSAATESSLDSVVGIPVAEAPSISKSRLIPPLSPTSFVTQTTETTISPRSSIKSAEQIATMVHISAADTVPLRMTDSSARNLYGSATFEFPIPKLTSSEKQPMPMLAQSVNSKTARRPFVARARRNSWKPSTSECPSEESQAMTPTARVLSRPKSVEITRQKPAVIELSYLQRNIRKMEAASFRIILERLKEDWVAVADASIYRELELEKQLWMLSALRSLKNQNQSYPEQNTVQPGTSRALSLYENHASASFLSALTTSTYVHHISANPLSPKSYANVRPHVIPKAVSRLYFRSNTFQSIHAFCLPAILPASCLPQMLKECHRTLTSYSRSPSPKIPGTPPHDLSTKAGTLHLTILDPSPLHETLGPRLRAWLNDHLIIYLEKKFLCVNPSRLFPIWLEDENLRAEGSTRLVVRFLASIKIKGAECTASQLQNLVATEGSNNTEDVATPKANVTHNEILKQELKSVVGRMLWKEMWGSYVQANHWWWEDEAIIEECESLGTCWEYAVIEAVKEG